MANMNDVKLQGRLTAKPELRTTKTNKKTVTFTLAVDRNSKDSGVDFIQVVAWNKTAEFVAQHFEKGQQILVDAKLQSRSVTDKNTGKSRTVMDVVVIQAYFCGNKPAAPVASDNSEPEEVEEEVEEETEDIAL